MDKFDRQIVALLAANARMAVASIAREVSLSRSAVSERIRQLEERGIIRGYHARIGGGGGAVRAYFELHYHVHRCEQYAALLRAIPEVKLCYTISGETDMLVYVEAASMIRLDEVRGQIENMPNIKTVKTHMILSELINNLG
ncbi:ArsR family transcriptional regulator [Zobellella denitrificans]|uniref:ArsR family transcriptional regulator n=1 Tax=Zobellella denitrificans TaxID=347534 RepID=A0A291HSG6_9GAMM|nr:Lrp/AsnC family transcriptional regulator [Zobellella denitrificans]ATG75052.1 ArsR family transcriptional regulator [Zobellella denitrificans]